MTREEQFLETMIETVKYDDDYVEKDALLTILRYSIISFDKKGVYGNKNNYFREYVDLRVPIPMLNTAKEFKTIFANLVSNIYTEPDDSCYEYWGTNIKPKLIKGEIDYIKEHNVIFDEIKEGIIQGIRGAKYSIWVAVAWFTDRDIFNELTKKKDEGLNIRIIISKEEANRPLLGELEKNFEVTIVNTWGNYNSNRMHNKFCIIDLEYVMHGSYNWSNNAKNNDETWATALDRDFVKKFADEFIALLNENK